MKEGGISTGRRGEGARRGHSRQRAPGWHVGDSKWPRVSGAWSGHALGREMIADLCCRRCSINLKPVFPAALVRGSLVNSGNQGDSGKAGKEQHPGWPSSHSSNICAAQAGWVGSRASLGAHGQMKAALQSLKALRCRCPRGQMGKGGHFPTSCPP